MQDPAVGALTAGPAPVGRSLGPGDGTDDGEAQAVTKANAIRYKRADKPGRVATRAS